MLNGMQASPPDPLLVGILSLKKLAPYCALCYIDNRKGKAREAAYP